MSGFITLRPIIGEVAPKSIAAAGGLAANQEINSVDGRKTPSWTTVLFRIIMHVGQNDQLTLTAKDLKTNVVTPHQLDLLNWKMNELMPDPLESLGIKPFEPNIPLVIGKVQMDSPAENANLKVGDKIIALNQTAITNWMDLITLIDKNPNENMTLTIDRNGKKQDIPILIGEKRSLFVIKHGFLGIAPSPIDFPKAYLVRIQYPPIDALTHAYNEVIDFSYFNLMLLGKLATGKLSLYSLGGPITIFESAGTALNSGWIAFLSFLAFLSVSIGLINLLPIPGLDGGHLFFQLIEFIIRRPIPERWLLLFYRLGFIFILLILIQAFVNDLLRLK